MISENLKRVQSEIDEACLKYGRKQHTVKLIAVSKTKPASDILLAYHSGQTCFGENYVQELNEKMNASPLNTLPIEWHFIGHLQSNKVRAIAEKIALIHTVDRYSLAEEISKRAANFSRVIPILLEVNISGEQTKHGLSPDLVLSEATRIMALPNLSIHGLMTIASPNRAFVQKEFREMRLLLEKLRMAAPNPEQILELSMGMSADFDIAIAEGATMLRIGSSIFGLR